jgi:hypothetical protein
MQQIDNEKRRSLIKEIENSRQSRLLVYITGDRRGLETRIAGDVFPLMHEHLGRIGHVHTLSVFIYTAGGDSLTGWGIVNLVREFCDELEIIIPFKALSCGTLISLGADRIIMTRAGQLSPIDPSLASPYNPSAPGQMQPGSIQLLPVSVEDVMGYLKLAREEVGIKGDEGLSKIMELLSAKVHPMALGAVYRSREQISLLATKLLSVHEKNKAKIEEIVRVLTKELPSHQYLISRNEAKVLGLKVVDLTPELERSISALYKEYEQWLELIEPYSAEAILGADASKICSFNRGVIESITEDNKRLVAHIFRTEREIRRVQGTQPGVPFPLIGVQERNIREQWIREEL